MRTRGDWVRSSPEREAERERGVRGGTEALGKEEGKKGMSQVVFRVIFSVSCFGIFEK